MMRHSNSLGGRASSFRMDFSDKPYDVFTYSVLHYSNSCFSLCSFKKKKTQIRSSKQGQMYSFNYYGHFKSQSNNTILY